MNKLKFCLGISKPLDILNNDIRKLVNFAIKKNFTIHTSITYPVNNFFIKNFLRKKYRHKINFICKILADSNKNLKKSVELSVEKYSIKKIFIIQLVNLPLKSPYVRNIESLLEDELNIIFQTIRDLKNRNIIKKVYIQIYSRDNLDFCKKILKYADGFAFYANINEIHLKREVYDYIVEKNVPSIVLSVFGNPKRSQSLDHDLHLKSYYFSQSFFSKNTIAVGRTWNKNRLEQIYSFNQKMIAKNFNFNPKFIETAETQDNPSNFYKRFKVTNAYYITIFILKCLIKKIIGQKNIIFIKNLKGL